MHTILLLHIYYDEKVQINLILEDFYIGAVRLINFFYCNEFVTRRPDD